MRAAPRTLAVGMNDRDRTEPQLLAMSLLATLRTAAEVCQALALRRAGHDPSDQEDVVTAAAHLRDAPAELDAVVSRLRISLVLGRDDDSALVQAFEERMTLAHAARLLHLVHQRLLSLYPQVDAALIEKARMLQTEAARLAAAGEDGFAHSIAAWVEMGGAFASELAGALD
jgi:hypothetical protein